MQVLIGGYTKHSSKGIYEFDLIKKDGQVKLTNKRNIVEIGGPTYFQEDNDLLFQLIMLVKKAELVLLKRSTVNIKKVILI